MTKKTLNEKSVIFNKKGKNGERRLKNYRPLSLLSICGKIFKTLFNNRMIKFLLKTNLLYQISPDLNCVIFALISFYLSLTISESFAVGLEVRSILLDISKAFDKVWYDGISFKLTQNRILRNLLNFLHDFLEERKQIVVFNGQVSI